MKILDLFSGIGGFSIAAHKAGPYRGKSSENCPESPRYKACGNAITVAVGEWVLRRLAKEGEVQNEIQ